MTVNNRCPCHRVNRKCEEPLDYCAYWFDGLEYERFEQCRSDPRRCVAMRDPEAGDNDGSPFGKSLQVSPGCVARDVLGLRPM